MPDDIVKAIQRMKQPTLDYPDKPAKDKCVDDQGIFDEDIFDMAKFTWKEDYKAMRVKKTNITRTNQMHGRLFMVNAHPS